MCYVLVHFLGLEEKSDKKKGYCKSNVSVEISFFFYFKDHGRLQPLLLFVLLKTNNNKKKDQAISSHFGTRYKSCRVQNNRFLWIDLLNSPSTSFKEDTPWQLWYNLPCASQHHQLNAILCVGICEGGGEGELLCSQWHFLCALKSISRLFVFVFALSV